LVEFIFDEKEKVKGRVQGHFDRAKEQLDADPNHRGTLDKCYFEDDRKVIPLQAADLLAYEMRRHTLTRITKGDGIPMRDAYGQIKASFDVIGHGQPPYRERLLRCYDKRFIQNALAKAMDNPDISDNDFADFWYLSDAPED
jgi:uncharacterized protein DUF3800